MIHIQSFERDLHLIRQKSPLIHNITNYVVMNNTANALLAVGASPVMAHSIDEAAEMAGIASALVINIGTLDAQQVKAMKAAAKVALANNTPIVFDPVGAGATSYRKTVCKQIIEECKPSVIRGNASEIIALCRADAYTKGVDSTDTPRSALHSAETLAKRTGAIVVVSGETDYITDGIRTETVKNGHPLMAMVTGMGCTATAIAAAFVAVNPNKMEAAAHAMTVMGIVGEAAAAKSSGNGSMQVHFLDELCHIDGEMIKKHIIQTADSPCLYSI